MQQIVQILPCNGARASGATTRAGSEMVFRLKKLARAKRQFVAALHMNNQKNHNTDLRRQSCPGMPLPIRSDSRCPPKSGVIRLNAV